MLLTYFVVQTFQRGKKGMLIADQPRQLPSKAQCEAMAERLAKTSASVVAFSRTGDPESGDWDDAVVFAQYGAMPDEMMQMSA